jgi:hypothetical protein
LFQGGTRFGLAGLSQVFLGMASRGRLIGPRLGGRAFGRASRKNQRDNDTNCKRISFHHLENGWAYARGCFFKERKPGKTPIECAQNKNRRTHPDRLPHPFLLNNEDQPYRFNCSRIDCNFSRRLRRHHGDDNDYADARTKLDVRPLSRRATEPRQRGARNSSSSRTGLCAS